MTENSEDLNRKCLILRDKELHLNRGEIDVKGPHAEGRILLKTREASSTKEATKWVEMGPGRSAQPISGPIRAPFDLAVIHTIYTLREKLTLVTGIDRLW
jgi:hypothetical protein